METWQGSRNAPVDFATVEAFIVEAHRRFTFSLRLDPWQGLDLAQRLRAQGVPTREFAFSQASKQRLAATLLSTVNGGKLRLYEAEGLRDELLGLRLAQASSGAWTFDHKSSGHDDRAVALALMVTALLERGLRGPEGRIIGGESLGNRLTRGARPDPSPLLDHRDRFGGRRHVSLRNIRF
jgi:hypothetical protein